MYTADDLTSMFNPDDPGVSGATFSHDGGAGSSIYVRFRADFRAVNLDSGMVESAGPQAQCRTADVANAENNDTLTINSVTYYIRGIQPDGTGITTLILSRD